MKPLLVRFRWPLAVGAVAVLAFVFVWFQPHKLFIDDVVDEELPGLEAAADGAAADADPAADGGDDTDEAPTDDGGDTAGDEDTSGDADDAAADADDAAGAADDEATNDEPATPAGPVDLAGGQFGSLGNYETSGTVRIVELEDGRRFVRLEDFATDNGPDLFVYLSSGAADGSEGFTTDFVHLGRLKGNIGDQNYEIPADVDLDRFTSVVIYCSRFSSAFGAATITPA